jgi:hypothetical protein
MRGGLIGLAASTLLLLYSTQGRAFEVYHSNDGGVTPSVAQIPTGGSTVLHLYFNHGTAPGTGTPCLDGTGEQVCGWDIHFSTTGSVMFEPGDPNTAPVANVVWNVQPTLIKANGGDPENGESGPTKFADVAVSSTGPGSVELTGKHFVGASLALGTVAFDVIGLTGPGPSDLDGDGIDNASDNCPTIKNGSAEAPIPGVGNQTNVDGDSVGDACDNCVLVANEPIGTPPAGRTTTGGQLDDDADGYGNRCDGDFSQGGSTVGGADTILYQAAIGKSVSDNSCLPSGSPCDVYDVSGTGSTIGGADTVLYQTVLLGSQQDDPLGGVWVKCPSCGPLFVPNLPCEGDACP